MATTAQAARLADLATDYRGMAGWSWTQAERRDGLIEVTETEPDGVITTSLLLPDGNWQADPRSTPAAEMAVYAAEAALDRQDPTAAREHLRAALRADRGLLRRFVRDLRPRVTTH